MSASLVQPRRIAWVWYVWVFMLGVHCMWGRRCRQVPCGLVACCHVLCSPHTQSHTAANTGYCTFHRLLLPAVSTVPPLPAGFNSKCHLPKAATLYTHSAHPPPLQAVWALGNIAGDSPKCRDLVLNTNALQPLLEQLKEQVKISMLRNATWTLSNFCRGKPQPDF